MLTTEQEAKKTFVLSIEKTSEAEILRDPSLLARDKNKAADLIENSVVQGDAYRDVEKAVDDMLAERRAEIEDMMKAIMEENGVPLLETEIGKDKDKDTERVDVDMQEATVKQEDDEKEKEKNIPQPVVERRIEELPVKRSRFDDTIGLHLKDRALRERTADPVSSPPVAPAGV